jgi:hypothetical protein
MLTLRSGSEPELRKGKEMIAGRDIVVLFVFGFVNLNGLGAERQAELSPPGWLHSGAPVRVQQVLEKDYPHLVQWVDRQAKPAREYVVRLFDTYQVVILAEQHNIREHKTFVMDLMPRLYHEAGVRCIGWEFSPYTLNARLSGLINAPSYDEAAVLQFARDCAPNWNSQEHWNIIKAVWDLNVSLKPGEEKMRFIGLVHDYDRVKAAVTLGAKSLHSPEFRASAEFKELVADSLKYDTSMAQQTQEQILQKGQKGLLFVGLGHDWTQYQYPPEVCFGIARATMGALLKEKYPDRVFQVRLRCDSDPALMDAVMKHRNHEWVGFDMPPSPFAGILVPVGMGAPDVPWCRLAEGYIYMGPWASFHHNTPIKGYVTEAMFRKLQQYYELDNGQRFNNAQEVDEYFQQHRWPKP